MMTDISKEARVAVIEEAIPQPWRKFIVALRDERDAARNAALEDAANIVGNWQGMFLETSLPKISKRIRALKSQEAE